MRHRRHVRGLLRCDRTSGATVVTTSLTAGTVAARFRDPCCECSARVSTCMWRHWQLSWLLIELACPCAGRYQARGSLLKPRPTSRTCQADHAGCVVPIFCALPHQLPNARAVRVPICKSSPPPLAILCVASMSSATRPPHNSAPRERQPPLFIELSPRLCARLSVIAVSRR